jgi:hypothetical protein
LDASSAATKVAAIPTHIAKLRNKHTQSNSLSQDPILRYPKYVERTQLKHFFARAEHRVYSSIHKDPRTTTIKKKADCAQVTYLPATKRTTRNTDDRIVLAIATAYPKNTTKKSAGKKKEKSSHKFFQCAK